MTNPIKVFISYSWDSEEHKNWVLNLADKLATEDIYVILDQYDLFAGKNMTHYMETSVDEADKVLSILTKNYKQKADNRTGGVGYEISMITQELFSIQATNNKFIPIRRDGTYEESAPRFIGTLVSHDMTNDALFDKAFKDLVKLIKNQPLVVRPALGISTSSKTSVISTKLIDDALNLAKSKMKLFGNWRISISLGSVNYDTPELFKLLKENLVFEAKEMISLPHIANDIFKVKHYPAVEYEMPLRNYMVDNWFLNEKFQIHPNHLVYEYSEYSNGDFILLNINQPFTSVFYLLVALDKIRKNKSIHFNLEVDVEFVSNGRATLYQKYSPFDFGFTLEVYAIPDNSFKLKTIIDKIDNNVLYDFYQRLYNAFISENPTSIRPFVIINKENFNMLVGKILI